MSEERRLVGSLGDGFERRLSTVRQLTIPTPDCQAVLEKNFVYWRKIKALSIGSILV